MLPPSVAALLRHALHQVLRSPSALLRRVLLVAAPLSVVLTIYLYLFPVFSGCGFPLPLEADGSTPSASAAFWETAKLHYPGSKQQLPQPPSANASASGNDTDAEAGSTTPLPERPILPAHMPLRNAPFRLLALGDPQLEGDSSIPNTFTTSLFPHIGKVWRDATFQTTHYSLRWRIRQIVHDLIDIFFLDFFNNIESVRKRIDLLGNDFYLAHIYRTVHWWTQPTHVTVLGDLLGSQWVDDAEFDRRADRFWDRDVLGGSLQSHACMMADNVTEGAAATIFDADANPSSDRLPPELRIVVLNSMNLDTPANSTELQDATYTFINSVINTASAVEYLGHFTLVLTHVPLHKPEGVCVDSPLFEFHDHDGSLREQNMLSADASKGFLEGILGMSGDTMAPANGRGRRGVILNGHDHEGCDTYHFINQTQGNSHVDRSWESRRWAEAPVGRPGHPGVREITVRSMMGDFGGNAGLLSAWFDEQAWEWRFEYATCPLGRQHLWWFVHIMDLLVVVATVAYPFVALWESLSAAPASAPTDTKIPAAKVNGASANGHVATDKTVKEPKIKMEEEERNGHALAPRMTRSSLSRSPSVG
ncbi:hypothetical protein MAPG_04944 [Magnaporthiopsis poae ATCC 64411]|uniref:Polarized growth protein n=1 Tax=Magnaporthiopsis poae (strain ATCC 64411 / 73-15) TaxID=644358 RepID=A0A0C4DY35_MAGP6|nr:hypothetical protein MAPG_04944 [Magnaporthiopsis poae ATCC 64411]